MIEESAIEFESEEEAANDERIRRVPASATSTPPSSANSSTRSRPRTSPPGRGGRGELVGPGAAAELPLRQLEHRRDQLTHALLAERALVRADERLGQTQLLVGVEEVEPARDLLAPQLLDELEPAASLGDDSRSTTAIRARSSSIRSAISVDDDGRADAVAREQRRRQPHRHAHAAVRGRIGRHGRVAVDREAAQEVLRVVEHPVEAGDGSVDVPGAEWRVPRRPGRDVDDADDEPAADVEQELAALRDLDVEPG